MNYYDENIIPKYRKRKKKKSPKKTNHEHDYKKVLIESTVNNKIRYHSGEKCTICRKITNERFFEAEKLEDTKWYRVLNQEEILEKYKECEVIKKDIKKQPLSD